MRAHLLPPKMDTFFKGERVGSYKLLAFNTNQHFLTFCSWTFLGSRLGSKNQNIIFLTRRLTFLEAIKLLFVNYFLCQNKAKQKFDYIKQNYYIPKIQTTYIWVHIQMKHL
jgi:hypothetical protein